MTELLRSGCALPGAAVRVPRAVTLLDVRLAVERVCGVTFSDIAGSERERKIVEARELFCLAAHELAKASFPEIARGMSRVNHSSAWSAIQRAWAKIGTRDGFARKFDEIGRECRVLVAVETPHRSTGGQATSGTTASAKTQRGA